MKINTLLTAGLFGLLLVVPTSSQAYFTTSQKAVDLGDGMALFTINYKFGFSDRAVYMPILASRNKDYTDKGINLGYSVLFNGKTEAETKASDVKVANGNIKLNYSVLPGKAKAIVLANAEIKDGRYYLPKGKAVDFTLVAIVDMSKTSSKDNLSLLVTSLPFTMIEDNRLIEAKLNPSELQYYVTPEIDLEK